MVDQVIKMDDSDEFLFLNFENKSKSRSNSSCSGFSNLSIGSGGGSSGFGILSGSGCDDNNHLKKTYLYFNISNNNQPINLENQVLDWIFSHTKTKLSKPICESLKNGVVLCRLINIIKPNTIKKINMGTAIFSYRENLTNFIKGCETIGMTEDMSRFQDLIFEDKESTVIQLLYSLMKFSEKISPTLSSSPPSSSSSSSLSNCNNSNNNNNNNNNKPSPVVIKRIVNNTPATTTTTSTTTTTTTNANTTESRPHSESIAKPILTALSSSSSPSSSQIFSTASTPSQTNTVPYKFIGHNKSKIFTNSQTTLNSIALAEQQQQQQQQNNNNKDETPAQPVVSPRKKPAAQPLKKPSPASTSTNSLLNHLPPAPTSSSSSSSSNRPKSPPTVSTSPIKNIIKPVVEEKEEVIVAEQTEKEIIPMSPEISSNCSNSNNIDNNNNNNNIDNKDNTEELSKPIVQSPKARPPLPSRKGRAELFLKESSEDDIQFEMEHAPISEVISHDQIEDDHSHHYEDNHHQQQEFEEENLITDSNGFTSTTNATIAIPDSTRSNSGNSDNHGGGSGATTTTTSSTGITMSTSHNSSLPSSVKNKLDNNNNNGAAYHTISTSTPTNNNNGNSNTILGTSSNSSIFSPPSPPISTSPPPSHHQPPHSSPHYTYNGSPNAGSNVKKPRSSTKQKLEKFFSKSKLTTSSSNLNTPSSTNSSSPSSNKPVPSLTTNNKSSSPNTSSNNLLSFTSSSSSSSSSSSKQTNTTSKQNGSISNSSSSSSSKKKLKESNSPDINSNNSNINNNINNNIEDEQQSTLTMSNQSCNSLKSSGNHFEDDITSSNGNGHHHHQMMISHGVNNSSNSSLNNFVNHSNGGQASSEELLQVNSEDLMKALSQVEYLFKDRKKLKDRINFIYPEKYKSFVEYDELLQMDNSSTFLTESLLSKKPSHQLEFCRQEERRYLSEIFTLTNVLHVVDENKLLLTRTEEMQKMIDSLMAEKKQLSSYIDTLSAKTKQQLEPRKMMQDDGITYNYNNGKYEIKGGTTEKLIELLYNSEFIGSDYFETFLLTYRSFASPKRIMEVLTKTYDENYSQDVTKTDDLLKRLEIDQDNKKKKETQLKICNFLKRWVEKHFYDFDQDLLQEFNTFISNCVHHHQIILQKTLDKKLSGDIGVTRELKFNGVKPTSILPKLPITSIEDMDPAEIARQLTLIEFGLFKNIANKELLSLSWQKSDKEKRSPNLLKMIYRFNEVSNWVTSTIVKETTNLKKRASYLKRFIRIAEELRKLNNFNGVFVIVSGLHSASVNRLKNTWGEISKQQQKQFEEFVALTSPNSSFAAYRLELRQSTGACVPYLGVHLSDLTFVEEGNQDKLENGYTNFAKCRLIAEQIKFIQEFQQQPYNLDVVEEMLPFLNHKALPESECFSLSLICEPRESVNN